MPGTPLDSLTVLVESQGAAWRTGNAEWVNDAVQRNYTHSRLLAHKDIKEVLRGGDRIQDRLFLSTTKGLTRYNPNGTLTGTLTNPGINYEVPWAFGATSISWTKQHLGLNFEAMGKAYRSQKYKDVLLQLKSEMWTGAHAAVDAEFWAPPDFTNMESGAATTRKPISIPALINEFQNGLPIGDGETSWTTKQQINPAAAGNSRWNCYQGNYSFTAAQVDGVFPGVLPIMTSFAKALRRTGLAELPMNKEYSDMRTCPHVIWTQEQGLMNYEFALLASQDHFRGQGKTSGQDPAYPRPSYRGVPLDWIEALGTAAIYPTGTNDGALGNVAWAAYDADLNATGTVITNIDGESVTVGLKGPRYYFMNLNHMHWAAHAANFFSPSPVITPSDQPFSRVQWWDLWNNLFASSLRTHAILTPKADTGDAMDAT